MRALDGLLVVALEQAVAVPFCTTRLADAGARVIKVERPEGDFAREYDHVVHGQSTYFVWLNRGKESIRLDVKDPADAAVLHRMIASADVFIQNLSPGAAARAGFGSDALRAAHPRLITCDVSGYGEDGPWAQMKAYDFLVQCEAGLAEITGGPSEPARVGVSVVDICCGMNAHAAILQALYERDRTGLGKGVAVSLFDSIAEWMAAPLLHQDYGGRAPGRAGLNHPAIAPYGAYAAGDGRQVVISVQNEREWRSFCEGVLQRPEVAVDPRFVGNSARCANRPALDAIILEALQPLDRDQFVERLRAAKVAYGELNSVADLSRHPQLRRIEVETAGGAVSLPAPAVRWKGEPELVPGSVPTLGAHDASLRAEFGT
ncbi:MAG: CaiB/BaiF CoA-transferase family protein [Phenylobacterium sp.]|uniref:CaiB/BaiF CoA transferase family protein n=1 Tax=Phenylobacterium sp. TaxID=1871053 RepID=UPI002732E59B|nr:CaiB/BaiF CoA-transferase family protein [Phenylobacterium sp.]MDP3176069.1 CaiB/BaiF CoA-transferase family protein [Phenylobacterium sp.]